MKRISITQAADELGMGIFELVQEAQRRNITVRREGADGLAGVYFLESDLADYKEFKYIRDGGSIDQTVDPPHHKPQSIPDQDTSPRPAHESLPAAIQAAKPALIQTPPTAIERDTQIDDPLRRGLVESPAASGGGSTVSGIAPDDRLAYLFGDRGGSVARRLGPSASRFIDDLVDIFSLEGARGLVCADSEGQISRMDPDALSKYLRDVRAAVSMVGSHFGPVVPESYLARSSPSRYLPDRLRGLGLDLAKADPVQCEGWCPSSIIKSLRDENYHAVLLDALLRVGLDGGNPRRHEYQEEEVRTRVRGFLRGRFQSTRYAHQLHELKVMGVVRIRKKKKMLSLSPDWASNATGSLLDYLYVLTRGNGGKTPGDDQNYK